MNPYLSAIYNRRDSYLESLLYQVNDFDGKNLNDALIVVLGDPELPLTHKLKYAESLMIAGASPNVKAGNDSPGIYVASERGEICIVQLLIEYGCDVNAVNIEGQAALHAVAFSKHSEICGLLLAAGADPNIRDENGQSPLSAALTLDNNKDIIELLLIEGNLKQSNWNNETPLHIAVKGGCIENLKMLLDASESVNAEDGFGMTPLMLSCDQAVQAVELLLAHPACDVNKPSGITGRRAVHFAAATSCGDVPLALLIGAKALLNCEDNDGKTPLYYAVEACDASTVKLLLRHNGQTHQSDFQLRHDSPSALQLAVAANCPEIALMLLAAGFKSNNFRQPLHTERWSQEGASWHNAVNWGKNPLPLKHCVRLSIRKQIKEHFQEAVRHNLGLPKELQDYLCFVDLDDLTGMLSSLDKLRLNVD